MARPTKYKVEYNKIAEVACMSFGADDKQLAKLLGIALRTLQLWKEAHPEFMHSIKKGKEVFDTNSVEVSLLQRALGYEHEEIKFFSDKGIVTDQRTIIKHYPPDTVAAIYWLNNRRSDRWKNRKAVEITGANGEPVNINVVTWKKGE
jgi:hypothetical protein